jgi:DNA-binding MarR family transcriptional regulator
LSEKGDRRVQLNATQALLLWHRVSGEVLRRDLPDLTQRQFAILLQVYLAPPPHTVRGIAADLKISKPAVTRAIDRLSGLDLVRRKVDENDRRSILLQRTVAGAVFLREFGDLVCTIAWEI